MFRQYIKPDVEELVRIDELNKLYAELLKKAPDSEYPEIWISETPDLSAEFVYHFRHILNWYEIVKHSTVLTADDVLKCVDALDFLDMHAILDSRIEWVTVELIERYIAGGNMAAEGLTAEEIEEMWTKITHVLTYESLMSKEFIIKYKDNVSWYLLFHVFGLRPSSFDFLVKHAPPKVVHLYLEYPERMMDMVGYDLWPPDYEFNPDITFGPPRVKSL